MFLFDKFEYGKACILIELKLAEKLFIPTCYEGSTCKKFLQQNSTTLNHHHHHNHPTYDVFRWHLRW